MQAGVDYNRPREFIPILHRAKNSHKKTRMRAGYARSGFLLSIWEVLTRLLAPAFLVKPMRTVTTISGYAMSPSHSGNP
jgi:hypothetical protein